MTSAEDGPDGHDRLRHHLRTARTVPEVVLGLFAAHRGLVRSLELTGRDGAPRAIVACDDVEAWWAARYLDGGWRDDPRRAEVARALGPVIGDDEVAAAPLIGAARMIGIVRLAGAPPAALRELALAVCLHGSVRLGELGLSAEDDAAARLTPRQRQIARLIVDGLTTEALARALGMSPNTAKKHLKAIFEALGIDSRAQLAVIASRFAAPVDALAELRRAGLHVLDRARRG